MSIEKAYDTINSFICLIMNFLFIWLTMMSDIYVYVKLNLLLLMLCLT